MKIFKKIKNQRGYPKNIEAYIKELRGEASLMSFQLTIKYGIMITTISKENPDDQTLLHLTFRIGDHIFENLNEVERALQNKSLL